jgi:glycogen synthase
VTRILAITNMYPPHHYGGYELSCRDVLERLRERGHDTAVLTTTMRVPGVDDGPFEDAEGIWRRLRFAWEDHELTSPSLRRRMRDERHNQRALADALDRFRPDVVSVWNMGAMSLGLLETVTRRDAPMVLNVCDDWLVYGPSLDPWARLFADRPRVVARVASLLARVPAGLPDLTGAPGLFVSEFTRRRALSGAKVLPGRSTVVWSGIDERDFPVASGPAGAGRPWGWRLLGVGRLDERKGIDVALRALARLPQHATLRWMGQGAATEEQRLGSLADELGVGARVTWGSAPRAELRAAYAEADAFIFPSTWGEPFGLVPIEAMACGVPVIGSGTGGSSEFLLDGVTALVTGPGDDAALAGAVHRVAEDASLRARLVDGGFRAARELTIGRLADVMERWHVAAAAGFPEGEPAHRVLELG